MKNSSIIKLKFTNLIQERNGIIPVAWPPKKTCGHQTLKEYGAIFVIEDISRCSSLGL
jgi:hypothetical protein